GPRPPAGWPGAGRTSPGRAAGDGQPATETASAPQGPAGPRSAAGATRSLTRRPGAVPSPAAGLAGQAAGPAGRPAGGPAALAAGQPTACPGACGAARR